MDIYHYDPATGILLSKDKADPDPMADGEFLMPAFTTTVKPPKAAKGNLIVFENGAWGYVRQGAATTPSTTPQGPTKEEYKSAIQALIDQTAQSREYDDGKSLASYVNSTVVPWAAEAAAFCLWRDQVWLFVNVELAKVLAGERTQPSVNDFLLELPEIAWPEEPPAPAGA